jgi:transposase InsO family protein
VAAAAGRLEVNLKKIYRLYREEGLRVKRRRRRRRAIGALAPIVVPQVMKQCWSLDFVSDQLANGRRFRLLNVLDDFNSECLAAVADFSLSSLRVIRELEAIMAVRRKPAIVSDDAGCRRRCWARGADVPTSNGTGPALDRGASCPVPLHQPPREQKRNRRNQPTCERRGAGQWLQ